DTLCAGGIMYGQRNIPQILAFCKDIREVARPGAWLLNYANPNAMNTWAALEYGKVNTLGLCHGVEGGQRQIAKVLKLHVEELDIICAGINHQTWYISVKHKGRELTGKLLAAFEKHPQYSRTEKIRIDMLRRFGYYTTESNGHVSEYVPWYRKRPREIRRWIDMSAWIHGETGGYLRLLSENRNWFRTDFPEMLKQPPWPITPENRSHEHAGYIIESLETGRVYRGHFNVRNRGVISNLPDDCVVEVPGYVDGNGVSIPHVGDLPLACAATLSASVNVQRLAVEAAVHGDVLLLKQAMLHDPLTAAVCNPEEIWQMTDEMLVTQAQWLPQYRREISRARQRLKSGPRVKTRAWQGAARRRVRSLAEMRKHAAELREVTLASDKGSVKRRRAVKLPGKVKRIAGSS
ncbi:MAG: alpha-glucosidase/alpha-galactosidase, partial [Kiritimatiellia bacterium]